MDFQRFQLASYLDVQTLTTSKASRATGTTTTTRRANREGAPRVAEPRFAGRTMNKVIGVTALLASAWQRFLFAELADRSRPGAGSRRSHPRATAGAPRLTLAKPRPSLGSSHPRKGAPSSWSFAACRESGTIRGAPICADRSFRTIRRAERRDRAPVVRSDGSDDVHQRRSVAGHRPICADGNAALDVENAQRQLAWHDPGTTVDLRLTIGSEANDNRSPCPIRRRPALGRRGLAASRPKSRAECEDSASITVEVGRKSTSRDRHPRRRAREDLRKSARGDSTLASGDGRYAGLAVLVRRNQRARGCARVADVDGAHGILQRRRQCDFISSRATTGGEPHGSRERLRAPARALTSRF